MEKLEYVGPYIYHRCQTCNISLSAICSFAGISYAELNNILNGKYEPHPNTLKRICDFVQIDFIALFKKQEKYKRLLEDTLHALTYDIMDEQKMLMEKIEKSDFEHSILYPEYLLIKAIYIGMNDPLNDGYEQILSDLAFFVNVFSIDYKGLYYIYKGIFYRERMMIDDCEQYFKLAEKLSPFMFREILYQHFGVLCYMQGKYLETLEYYNLAYELYEKKWNINRLLYTKNSVGFCYIGMRRYDLAHHHLKMTLRLAQQYKHRYVMCNCLDNLAYNCLLMRDYEKCIHYAMKAINAGSSYPYIYFYLAYAYARLHAYGEAALWAGKREEMNPDSDIYSCLVYVKKIIDKLDDVSCIMELYQRLEHSEIKEIRMMLLQDAALLCQEQEDLESENRILSEIIKNII